MKLVGLMGYARSGKNTAAQVLTNQGWTQRAFADALREMLYVLDPIVELDWSDKSSDLPGVRRLQCMVDCTDWDVAKSNPEVRRLMQVLGTECVRTFDTRFWVNILRANLVDDAVHGVPGVVVTDVRFQNEVDFIRAEGGKLIWIDKPGVGPLNDHESEAMTESTADAVIVNNGTEEELWSRVLMEAGLKPKIRYLNLYRDDVDGFMPGGTLHETRREAIECSGGSKYIKTVEIEV